jgi:hypothetical protein
MTAPRLLPDLAADGFRETQILRLGWIRPALGPMCTPGDNSVACLSFFVP